MIAKTTIEVACYPSECNTLDVEEYNKRKKMLWLPADEVKEVYVELINQLNMGTPKASIIKFLRRRIKGLEKTEEIRKVKP